MIIFFASLDDDGHGLNWIICIAASDFFTEVIVLLKVIADLLVTNLVDN